MSTGDKVLSSILGLLILAIIGAIVYVSYSLTGERFTEFYILGQEGKATDYPDRLKVGEEGKVTVGVVNHEHETVTYQLEVFINEIKNNETGPITLERDNKWENIVSFIPHIAGDRQKVEFLLYKQGQSQVYQSLHLWVDVEY